MVRYFFVLAIATMFVAGDSYNVCNHGLPVQFYYRHMGVFAHFLIASESELHASKDKWLLAYHSSQLEKENGDLLSNHRYTFIVIIS